MGPRCLFTEIRFCWAIKPCQQPGDWVYLVVSASEAAMSARISAAVYRATSRPVLKRFCRRIRATASALTPFQVGWTVSDATNDQIFTISVHDNTVRTLVGTLKRISTGVTLATIALDQPGTGTLTYSDNTVAAITRWTLSQ